MSEKKSVFKTLSEINVNDYTKTKGNLTYLSWAHALHVTKEHYPNAKTKVYENSQGLNYFHVGKTAYVKCGVTIEGIELIEY